MSIFLTGTPWLPTPLIMQWAQAISWAVVLGAALVWIGGRVQSRLRWTLALGVAVWALLPGPISPTYWLGLSFQSPSLMSVALLTWWLVRQWVGARFRARTSSQSWLRVDKLPPAWVALWVLGVALGWVLLPDMLAWWPSSVYAWGFGTLALALTCALASTMWLVWGSQRGGAPASVLLALVLLVFVVTRLPSGNVFDALLDPWLWITLQMAGLVHLWRYWRARWF